MNGPNSPCRRPPSATLRGVPLLLVVAAAALCVVPSGSVGIPVAPHAAGPQWENARPSLASVAPPAGLAGAAPSGRVVDAPALFRAFHSFTVTTVPSGAPVPAPPAAPVAPRVPSGPPATAAPSAGAAGWVTGTVVDSLYGTPLANVSASSSTVGPCAHCQTVFTNASGFFRVAADPGFVEVTFDLTDYVENLTTVTVTSGVVLSIGTVNLVHFATVYGVVAADLPGEPRLRDVDVTSVSRDFGESGPDSALSSSNGSFRFFVDPLPAEVDFSSPSTAYLPNSTDVATTPWEVLNVGTVLLEGGVVAYLHLADALTGATISGGFGRYCSDRIDGACFSNRTATNSSVLLTAVAGPGYVVVDAGGYVANSTQVPDVPSGTAGPVDLGTVDLLPLGVVEVTVNFTGGSPNGTWPTVPGFEVVACSLSGMYTGVGLVGPLVPASCLATPVRTGQTVLAAASPLRNAVFVVRCYFVPDGFPIAEYGDSPGGCPHPTANVSWANVTPDQTTVLGSLNVEAGTYLSGTIALTGPQANSSTAIVSLQACSTVRLNECGPPTQSSSSGPLAPVPSGCPATAWAFCVPSPPGPVRVSAQWGPIRNSTWALVPRGCCSQEGNPTNIGTIGLDTDLGAVGAVYGQIAIVGDSPSVVPPGGWIASVQVCAAVPSLLPCLNVSVDSSNGTFFAVAPVGWDSVTVNAAGFAANETWIDVVGNNSTGTIELTPVGSVAGRVVSAATGEPVLESEVVACNVASHLCRQLGTVTDSNGTFLFPLRTLPYPAGTFQIEVTASGFDPESTFANVTAGATSPLGTVRMPPIGLTRVDPGALAPRGANSSTPTTGSWVTGRLVDRSSGLGVGLATILVCQLLVSNSCSYSSSAASTGGEFNLSTVHGSYELWLNSTYYTPVELFLNATAAGTVALGLVNLSQLPRITGRVLVHPWESLAATEHEGADQVGVAVCATASRCGPVAATDPAGDFNASAPATGSATVEFIGSGPAAFEGNGDPGFSPLTVTATVTTSGSSVNGSGPGGTVPLPILGGVSGYLTEFGGAPERPAFFSAYGVTGSGAGVSAVGFTGGAGYYLAFLPGGASGFTIEGSAYGLVPTSSTVSNGTIASGGIAAGPTIVLDRFGFVTAQVHDAATGRPLAGVFFTASATVGTNVTLVGSGMSNGSGEVNLTSPPGTVTLTAGSPTYGNWTGNTSVPVGGYDAFGGIGLDAIPNGGVVIVRTAQVNTVSIPVTPGAYDNVSGRPVPEAIVEETGAVGVDAGPVLTNDLGQFFLAGIPAEGATLSITGTAFDPFSVVRNLSAGSESVFQPLNLTAGGILAGSVVAEPGNVTVPYATVSVCAVGAPVCRDTVTTNATGAFWIWAPNATVSVTVVSDLYLSNLTRLVSVPSDGFVELGKIPVYSFGTVRGIVRGLPSGGVLAGANVSVCSQYSPARGCLADESVTTDANGSFAIESPPGLYFLYVTYPGYNASRFEFVLGPGEDLNFGVVVLDADGIEVGTVATPSGSVLPGATVLSCGRYSGATCLGTTTASDGGFRLVAPPGPNAVTVSASGYLDTVVDTTVVSGGLVNLGTVVVQPAPPDVFENVTGFVTASPGGGGLPGALLVASEGGARVAQAYTVGTGYYDLELRWGTPTILVELPGYRSASRTVLAHTNVSDVNFSLATMTYGVDGVTFDGGTGTVLAGVVLSENGQTLVTSADDGSFHLDLPNGTVTLLASHPSVGPVVYGSVPFPVEVSGGSVVHDLTIPRTVVPLDGAIVDAATGQLVASATVTLWGSSGAEVANSSTGTLGSFEFAVGPGTYNVSVVAPGFEAANVTVATGPAGTRTTVGLVETASMRASSSSLLPGLAEVGAVVAVVAVGAVVLARWRRRRPPPGERYYRPGEPYSSDDEPPT